MTHESQRQKQSLLKLDPVIQESTELDDLPIENLLLRLIVDNETTDAIPMCCISEDVGHVCGAPGVVCCLKTLPHSFVKTAECFGGTDLQDDSLFRQKVQRLANHLREQEWIETVRHLMALDPASIRDKSRFSVPGYISDLLHKFMVERNQYLKSQKMTIEQQKKSKTLTSDASQYIKPPPPPPSPQTNTQSTSRPKPSKGARQRSPSPPPIHSKPRDRTKSPETPQHIPLSQERSRSNSGVTANRLGPTGAVIDLTAGLNTRPIPAHVLSPKMRKGHRDRQAKRQKTEPIPARIPTPAIEVYSSNMHIPPPPPQGQASNMPRRMPISVGIPLPPNSRPNDIQVANLVYAPRQNVNDVDGPSIPAPCFIGRYCQEDEAPPPPPLRPCSQVISEGTQTDVSNMSILQNKKPNCKMAPMKFTKLHEISNIKIHVRAPRKIPASKRVDNSINTDIMTNEEGEVVSVDDGVSIPELLGGQPTFDHTKQFCRGKPIVIDPIVPQRPQNVGNFVCHMCGRRYLYKHSLAYHMAIHMNKKEHACPICGKMFLREANVKAHFKSSHQPKTFKCPDCPKMFSRKQEVKVHQITHTPIFSYQCNMCLKWFKSNGALTKHKQRHLGIRNHKCSFCEKRFYDAAHRKVHEMIHTGEKKWECSVCHHRFRQKNQLLLHRKTHTGEKPFKCRYCDKRFSTKFVRKNHEKSPLHAWDQNLDIRPTPDNHSPQKRVEIFHSPEKRIQVLSELSPFRQYPPPPPPVPPPPQTVNRSTNSSNVTPNTNVVIAGRTEATLSLSPPTPPVSALGSMTLSLNSLSSAPVRISPGQLSTQRNASLMNQAISMTSPIQTPPSQQPPFGGNSLAVTPGSRPRVGAPPRPGGPPPVMGCFSTSAVLPSLGSASSVTNNSLVSPPLMADFF